MAGSTWTWNGGSAAASAGNWTLTSGPGNRSQQPTADDTAIIPDGTVVTGLELSLEGNTIDIGGTAGVAAALIASGDTFTNFGTPSADGATMIASAVPGHTSPEVSVLDAGGVFVNEGTILADGPAGSVFTINVAPTTVGTTTLPGYFFNFGTIEAAAGNTLVLNVGSESELLNAGSIVADGGTVVVNVARGAIAGGDGPVRGFEVIEGGGTLITAASYPASDGNNGTHGEYEFGDSTAGNTLKIENIGSFGGVIFGFGAGDTIDLGTSLAVGTLAYRAATGLLSLESADGATLATLWLGNFGTGLAAGSFPVIAGAADGIDIGVGADGDTVLTTSSPLLETSGTSGTWQTATSWLGGVVPGATASVSIGLGASAPFTLTTGSTPVSVGGFGVSSALATVEITSDMTLTTGQISDYAGTVDIAPGATLTGGAIQLYEPSASLMIAAGATADLAGRINPNLEPSGGVWSIQPGGNSYAVNVSAGTAVIDGSLLAGPPTSAGGGGSTAIGYDSDGPSATVIVNASGTVTDTHTTIGSDLTSAGTLVLDGTGASWTDEINNADTYDSRGNMTVGYDDAAFNVPSGLPAPPAVTAAELVVENGATLTEQAGASIGNTVDSAGNVTIETGGLWNIGTPGTGEGIGVGAAGSGTLSVLNGGTVAIYTGGTFISNGTTRGGGGIGIGQTAGAYGTVIVSGPGSELSSLDGMAVGQGGEGLLSIMNGGTVLISASGVSVGTTADAASSGTIDIGGSGSAAFLNFSTAAGGLTVGSASQGTLIVADNGTLNLDNSNYLTIGGSAGAVGTVVVGGTTASAVINLGTAGLTVGNAGTGYLTVGTLGTISMGGTRAIVIGQSAGAIGTITVDGASARLSASGGIDVGWLGQAALTVENGATVNTSNLVLDGQPSGPTGTLSDQVSVTSGGRLEATGALYVWQGSTVSVDSGIGSGIDVGTSGSFVTGAINVENGHSIVGDGLIAASVINSGVIQAASATAPNTFTAGTLEIQGNVTGSGAIDIGANAIIRLDGSVAAGQVLNFSTAGAGELILNAPGSGLSNAITGLADGDKIEFGNGMTITGASVVNGNTIAVDFNGSGGLPGVYDLTNAGFTGGTNEQLSWGFDPSTGDADIQVQPLYFNWVGGFGTSYGTLNNWQGDTVPNASDGVSFVNNPGTVTGSGSALTVNVGAYNVVNLGTWTFAGTDITVAGQPSPPYLPYAIGFLADTVLNGGTLNAAGGDTNIGNVGGVTVIAEGGVKVTTLADSVGTNSGQSGSLLLTGAGTEWTELSGAAVNGTTPGFLNVGFGGPSNGLSGSAGYLTVTNGASLVTGGYADLAGGSGSFGSGTISAGGTWTIGRGLTVGGGGDGTLAIGGGAVSVAGYVAIGQNAGAEGTLAVSSGSFTTTSQLALGTNLGSFGDVSLNNGTIAAAGGVQVGYAGAGLMTIAAGGTLLFGGTYNPVGGNAGAAGTLSILNGGTAEATQAPGDSTILQIGNSGATNSLSASSGAVIVDGAGSLLNLDGNGLAVGSQGIGTLTVAQGATVDAGILNSNLDATLLAGFSPGSDGRISVTGAGSALNLEGYVGLGQAGSATLNVSNDGLVNITNSPTNASGFGIGVGSSTSANNTGGQGEASVTTGGTLSSQNGFVVGGNGVSGVLNVNTGGTVLAGTGFTVGTATEIGGTIYGGTGSLNIGAGGTVLVTEAPQTSNYGVVVGSANSSVGGSTDLATGVMTVNGAGALLDTNGNGIAVGLLSNGILTIGQGATVESGTPNSADISALSVGRQGDGSVIVNSGTLLADGEIYVGRAGTGDLLVENDGSVNVGLDGTGSTTDAALEIGGAGYSNGTLLYVGGTGSMQVDSGGTVTSQLAIGVGHAGTNGNLSIDDGMVETNQIITIGSSTTAAAGDSLVTASGTTIATAPTLEAGDGSVEIGAGGTLMSTSAPLGAAQTGTSSIVIGGGTGANASVTVQGAGALLSSGDNRLGVGAYSDGSLTISQGASVRAESSAVGNEAMYIGGSGGTGAVTVSDAGSSLTALGQLDVGWFGAGNLLIENQASVFTGGDVNDPAQGFDVGSEAGASGAVTVTGTHSVLSNTGRFVVGDGGLDSLSIQAGGTVVTSPGTVAGLAGAVIAAQSSASGSSVNVTGAGSGSGSGSDWQVGGALDVGDAGAGVLDISNGGSVGAASIDTGVLTGGFGDIVVNGTASQLTATGDFIVGDTANADVGLSGGGTITAGNINIGLNAGASGVVDVEGDSVLNTAGTLNIGDAGNAVLSLGADATVNAASFNIGTAGLLVEFGDPINSGTVTNSNSIVVAGGSNTTTATVKFIDNGLIEVENGGTETITTPSLTGTGTMQISTGGDLVLNAGSVAATQTILFADATGTLTIGPGGIGDFGALIQGFAAGDKIIVDTSVPATFSQSGSLVSVVENTTTLGVLTFSSPQAATAATTAGALVDNALCFLAGTLITTPTGQTEVERLAVGDLVLTAGGRVRPVVWIGQGRVLATRGRRNAATPVIVRKGALAPNVPHDDLRVTKGHSLHLDGVLIPVEFLVNHRSILWDDRAQEVSVYHVELETHDVLLANGAAAESFRNDGNRWLFQNAYSGWDLPAQTACAPVVTGGPVVDAVWRQLLEQAGPRPAVPLTADPDLHVLLDGVRVEAASRGDAASVGGRTGEVLVFALPGGASGVRLVSRAAVPQELGVARDPRCLGVAVRRIVLRQGTRFRVLRADDPALAEGFYPFEADNGLRWTDGDAALPDALFAGFDGPVEVVVHLGGTAQYVEDGRRQHVA